MMQMYYYSRFPYWMNYYGMLAIPKPIRDWGYNFMEKRKDRIPDSSRSDVD